MMVHNVQGLKHRLRADAAAAEDVAEWYMVGEDHDAVDVVPVDA